MQTLQEQLNSSLDGQFLFSGINSDVKPMDDFFSGTPSASRQSVTDAFTAKFGMSPDDPAVASISASDMQGFLDNEFSDLFSDANWANNWSAASDKAVTNRISRTEVAATSTTANDTAFRKLTQAYAMVSGLGFHKSERRHPASRGPESHDPCRRGDRRADEGSVVSRRHATTRNRYQ